MSTIEAQEGTEPRRRLERVVAGLASRRASLVIWTFSILIHLGAYWIVHDTPLHSDALSYTLVAERLSTVEHFDPFWPPGLSLYLVASETVFGALGTSVAVARASMLPFFFLLAWLLYRILIQTAGRLSANLALIALNVYPMLTLYSLTPFTPLPVACLLLLALWVIARATVGSVITRTLLLALALALLPLFRASALVLSALLPAMLWWRTRRWRDLWIPYLAVAVALGLWLAKAHDLAGRFVPVNTANVRNFYLGNNPWTPLYRTWWFGTHSSAESGADPAFIEKRMAIDALPHGERDATFRREALAHIAARPDLFVLRTLNRIRAFFAFDILTAGYVRKYHPPGSVLVLAAIVGLDAILFLGVTALAWLMLLSPLLSLLQVRLVRFGWLFGILYALPYFFSFSHPTYHFPLVPLLAVGAFAVFVRGDGNASPGFRVMLASPFRAGRRRQLAAIAGLLLLAGIQVEWVLVNALAA